MRQLSIIKPEEIRMDQTPTKNSWNLTPLYKMTIDGDIQSYQITFNGSLEIIDNDSVASIEIEHSIGLLEARRLYKLKYKEGYRPAGQSTPSLIKAMKANDYKPNSIKIWPVYVQPKLHGIRMLAQDTGRNNLSLRSGLNNPFTHLNHIEQELQEFFPYLPRYATLDGELYNHNMSFSTLTSAVKTTKSIHPNLCMIQYWIFDIQYEDSEETSFENRCLLLINAFRKYIQDRSSSKNEEDVSALPKTFMLVPTQIAQNHNDIMMKHDQYVNQGYEGIMIKRISNGAAPDSREYKNSLYKSGKCSHILKYKKFIDEEATIINIDENNIFVTDNRGHTYSVLMKEIIDKSSIGKKLTIRYQKLSNTGIPISPLGIAVRDYE